MGMILSQVVTKLIGGGPVCESQCHDVRCCTSTQRVVDPRWPNPDRPRQISDSTGSEKSVRSFGRKRKRYMTTIYCDSRKRVAGDDASFEMDIGETIHLQTGAKLSILKFRVADAFLSTDRGQYLLARGLPAVRSCHGARARPSRALHVSRASARHKTILRLARAASSEPAQRSFLSGALALLAHSSLDTAYSPWQPKASLAASLRLSTWKSRYSFAESSS